MKATILSLLFCLLVSLPALPGAEPRRERVYISTDKEVYVAGDAVWLSAWCLDAGTGRLSDFSKIAYVEVHSPTGMVQTAKLALEGGRGAGRLTLPTTLPTGNYRLFAYTQLGASEEGFDPLTGARTLSVFNTFSNERAAGVEVVEQAPMTPAVPSTGTLQIEAGDAKTSSQARIVLVNNGAETVSFSLSVRHDDGIPGPAGARIADFVQGLRSLPAVRGFNHTTSEYEGEIIRGHVTGTDEAGRKALLGKQVYLSSPGTGENLYAETITEGGQVTFVTSNIYGDRELFLEIEGLDNRGAGHLELESPFLNLAAGEIPSLQLYAGWASALELRGLGMQVEKNFDADTLYNHLPTNLHRIFDGRDRTRYVLDDYTRFPLMEELFIEFIPELRVRRVNDRRELQVRIKNHQNGVYFPTSDALVMLDGIPVLDHEKVLSYDPLLVQFIDIYEKAYFFGPKSYTGVVNFVTYKGTLPSMQFADNVRIVDFQGCSLPLSYTCAGVDARYPDFRQTIYWHPILTLAPGERLEIECKTPLYDGRFDVVAEGLTRQGSAVFGQASFEIR